MKQFQVVTKEPDEPEITGLPMALPVLPMSPEHTNKMSKKKNVKMLKGQVQFRYGEPIQTITFALEWPRKVKSKVTHISNPLLRKE